MFASLRENKIFWLLLVLYFAVFSLMASLRHYNFQTQTWDMGAFVQTFWNTTQGRIMFNNLEEVRNHLGVHMSPWLFVLIPGYAIFQSPYYLLIVQALALALGAWPLYLLALKVLADRRLALLVVGGYFLYPPLHWVNLFDFHEIAFFAPLMIASLYFIESKNWLWAGIFLALSASVEENAILAVLFVGIYLLARKEKKSGILVCVLAIVFFILTIKVFMPALGGGLLRLDRYAHLGNTPLEILRNLILRPKLVYETVFTAPKLFYVLWLFLPTAFLPFLSLRSLILLIPGLAQNLLTFFEFQFSSFYQYDSILIPGIWVATIYGLKIFLDKWPHRGKAARNLILVFILLGFLLRSPVKPLGFPTALFKSNPRWEVFRQMLKLVPEDDDISVAAQTNLVPHLSHRLHAHMLGREPFATDVVLVDLGDTFGFPDRETFENYLQSYFDTGRYVAKKVGERGLVIIRADLVEVPHTP